MIESETIEHIAFLAYKKKKHTYCEQDLEKYNYFDGFDSEDLFSAGGEAVSAFD